MSRARCGRRCCSISSTASAGARPTSASACSAWSRHAAAGAGAAAAAAGAERCARNGAARHAVAAASSGRSASRPPALQALLCVAGVACCVAMSMPQVHIVAYCGDLGFGAARGAEMLSLMLGFGIVSRLASGWISRPHRRAAHAAAGLGRCRASRCCCSCRSTAWRRSTSSRRCSACSRAASCRRTRSSCASTFTPQRSRRARRHGADGHAVRHGAGRLDVRARSSI